MSSDCAVRVGPDGRIAVGVGCTGGVWVRTPNSYQYKLCGSLHGVIVGGPMTITGDECHSVLHPADMAHIGREDGSVYTYALAMLSILSLFLTFMVIRGFLIMRKVPADYYVRWTKGELESVEDPVDVSTHPKLYHLGSHHATVSFKRFLLALCFITPLSHACTSNFVRINNHTVSAVIRAGDRLCTSVGSVVYENTILNAGLTSVGFVSEWGVEVEQQWGCAGGRAPWEEDCVAMNQRDMGFDAEGKGFMTLCESFKDACGGLNRGTWEGKAVVRRDGELMELFTVGSSGGAAPSYSIPKGCRAMASTKGDMPRDVTYLDTGRGSYACEGRRDVEDWDILYDKQGKIRHMSRGIVSCIGDWYAGIRCVKLTESYGKYISACSKLPAYVGGVFLRKVDDSLEARSDSDLEITLNCDQQISVLVGYSECHVSRAEVWVGHGDFETTGVFVAISEGKESETVLGSDCIPGGIIIPCDGRPHYRELQGWAEGCVAGARVHQVNHLAMDLSRGLDNSRSFLSPPTQVFDTVNKLSMGTLVLLGVVIVVFIVLICRR